VQIAEDIPADQYGFRAAEGTMTVGEMLAHMATSPIWAIQSNFVEHVKEVTGADFGRYMGQASAAAAPLTNKEAIVAALKSNGEDLAQRLEGATEAELAEQVALPGASKSRFEILLGVKEHEMHHRAQLMQIERQLGIVPHLTRARMERNAAAAAEAQRISAATAH
jgi:uncharacterized damage-inducible protein DinB